MPALSQFHKNKILGDFTRQELDKKLSSTGVPLEIGPFSVDVSIKFKNIRDDFIKIYQYYPLYNDQIIVDHKLSVFGRNGFRQYFRKQAYVETGITNDFIPLPAKIGMVSLEMGFNWQIAMGCRQYLMFHAGVVSKNGVGLIMPAMSGSGKSTLAAGLSYNGWQLHSDEFGLLDMDTTELIPYPRAVSLKNQSIPVMKKWLDDRTDDPLSHFTHEYEGTPKGTICYLRPPLTSIENMHERCKPNKIILPVYDATAKPSIRPITKTMAFFRLVVSSANYGEIGEDAFKAIADIVENSDACEITYATLDDAVKLVEEFVQMDQGGQR